jgi:hypothetical protein
MSVRTPKTMRSRTITHITARISGRRRDGRAGTSRRAARSRRQLEHDLPDEEDERARDVEAVGQKAR